VKCHSTDKRFFHRGDSRFLVEVTRWQTEGHPDFFPGVIFRHAVALFLLLLQLLFGTKVVGVSAAPFAAIRSPWRKSGVALAANHLLAVVLLGQHAERGLDDAAAEAKHQVERRLLLNVVVGQGATVLQLLAGENQSLLIRRNSLFVLNFGLDIFDGIAGFHLEGDRLPRQRFHENLHARSSFSFLLETLFQSNQIVFLLKSRS